CQQHSIWPQLTF
nr:immunoglobulin light chain junction region [Macaca mulatta]MPO02603.1 immunoglobulin light chain junction region [Macaca mulatta]